MAETGGAASPAAEGSYNFRPSSMVFHGPWIGFRIRKDDAIAGNNGDARLRDAGFFLGHLL